MKKQHDIIILDNALPKSLADEVENTTINPHFPYFYTFDIDKEEEVSTNTRVFYDKNTVNSPQFVHLAYNYENPNIEPYKGLPWCSHQWSMFDLVYKTCIEKAVVKDLYNRDDYSASLLPVIEYIEDGMNRKELFEIQPIRIKVNMLLNHSKVTSSNQNNVAHIDNKYFNSYSGIYYVNDSDGDTIIYNEKWSSQNPYRPENLTEKMRIAPKKNRFVLFDGLYYHTSTNPIENENRVVINMNFLNGKEAHKYA